MNISGLPHAVIVAGTFVATIVLCLIIGELTYKYVDAPEIMFSKKIYLTFFDSEVKKEPWWTYSKARSTQTRTETK